MRAQRRKPVKLHLRVAVNPILGSDRAVRPIPENRTDPQPRNLAAGRPLRFPTGTGALVVLLVAAGAFVLVQEKVNGETIVPAGALPSDTTWTASGHPFIVTGDIEVPTGTTLRVEDGTRVLFAGPWTITVNGTLIVTGNNATSFFDLAPNATSTQWSGILIHPGGVANLSRAQINGSAEPVACRGCARLNVSGLTISNASGTGLNLSDVIGWDAYGLTFSNNSRAALITNSSNGSLSSCLVDSGGDGIEIVSSHDLFLSNLTLRNVTGTGISLRSSYNLGIYNVEVEANVGVFSWASHDFWMSQVGMRATYGLQAQVSLVNVSLSNFNLSNITVAGADIYNALNVTLSNWSIGLSLVRGLSLLYGVDVWIDSMQIDGATTAIYLEGCQNIQMRALNVTRGGLGVAALGNQQLKIYESTFLDGRGYDVYFSNVRDSTVWRNNFIGPELRALLHAFSEGGTDNVWDFAGVGNFWYPHNYTDGNADGIGDSNVTISGSSAEADRFPRMLAWWRNPPQVVAASPASTPEDTPFVVTWIVQDDLGYVTANLLAGGNGTATGANETQANVTMPTPGSYTLMVVVTNLAGLTANATVTVDVLDRTPPAPQADGPTYIPVHSSATIDLTNSTDNDPSFPAGATLYCNVSDPVGGASSNYSAWPSFSFVPTLVGFYDVTCTVTDAAGNANQASWGFNASDVDFPTLPLIGFFLVNEDVPIQLGPVAVQDDDPTIQSTGFFQWQLFQGGTEMVNMTGAAISLTLANPGRFFGLITVCDFAAHCSTQSFQIRVVDVTPPNLSALTNFTVRAGWPAELSAGNATDNDPQWPSGASIDWDLEMGNTTIRLSGLIVVTTFDLPGVYQGRLTVRDAEGNVAHTNIRITAKDLDPPVLKIEAPILVEVGQVASFDASNSTDATLPLRVTWDFGPFDDPLEGPLVSRPFHRIGVIHVSITVTDAEGNSNFTTIPLQVVDSRGPTLTIVLPNATGAIPTVRSGDPMRFEVIASDPSGVSTITWEFGDGGLAFGTPVTHVFAGPGNRLVRVTAVDAQGNSNSATVEVQVEPAMAANPPFLVILVATSAIAVTVVALLVGRRLLRRTQRRDEPPHASPAKGCNEP